MHPSSLSSKVKIL